MPELTVTVRVPLPNQPTLAVLERTIFTVLMAAGRDLLLQAFGDLEERLHEAGAGAKQRRRRRYLITRFGELRFVRWQTRTEAGYGHPLDEALGLPQGDPCSPWVRRCLARPGSPLPHRGEAAREDDRSARGPPAPLGVGPVIRSSRERSYRTAASRDVRRR